MASAAPVASPVTLVVSVRESVPPGVVVPGVLVAVEPVAAPFFKTSTRCVASVKNCMLAGSKSARTRLEIVWPCAMSTSI